MRSRKEVSARVIRASRSVEGMRTRIDAWLSALPPNVLVAAITGVTALLWTTAYLHGPWAGVDRDDLHTFERTADGIAAGQIPYRDFNLEYPPGAAIVFWLARAFPGSFVQGLSTLMLVCLLATVVAAFQIAMRLGFGHSRAVAAAVVTGASPLLLGGFMRARFDYAMIALVAWSLWAAVAGRFTLAWLLLALAALVKLEPAGLAPALVLYQRWREGSRSAWRGAAIAAATLVVVFVPLVAIAPSGMRYLARFTLKRPLELESSGASAVLVLHKIAAVPAHAVRNYGSYNLEGTASTLAAIGGTLLLVTVAIAMLVRVGRLLASASPQEGARLYVAAVAATTAAILVFGKVLTTQFPAWLVPAALLVEGVVGLECIALVAVAMILTNVAYPSQLGELFAFHPGAIALVAVRNLALAGVLIASWPRRRLWHQSFRGVPWPATRRSRVPTLPPPKSPTPA
jgi:hypothetical protein